MKEFEASVTPPVLVNTLASVARVVERLSQVERIAADTEGNGMYAYRPSICVVQLAVAVDDRPSDEVYLIDALALGDLRPLAELLSERGPVKILHDIGFDARMLAAAGITLGNVVDTSIHARFLGERETGLASLLANRFGLSISKAMQQHDWGLRPLGPEALAYLATDVMHLGPLAASLGHDAIERDIVPEIVAETLYTLERAVQSVEPEAPAYTLVRGARALGPKARAVLREVFAVREALAAERDVPVGRILSSAALVGLSRTRPNDLASLRRVEGFVSSQIPYAEAILAAVVRGAAHADVPEDDRRWFVPERPPSDVQFRKAREAALTAWRRTEAEARGVDPQVVLPGHALSMLATRGAQSAEDLRRVPGLGELRISRYGDVILTLMNPSPCRAAG